MVEVGLGGPLAGAVIALLGLILLFAPARALYRKRSPVMRRPAREPEPPLWAKLFFRILGALLLAFAALLLYPAL